jgi:hypothetical protein
LSHSPSSFVGRTLQQPTLRKYLFDEPLCIAVAVWRRKPMSFLVCIPPYPPPHCHPFFASFSSILLDWCLNQGDVAPPFLTQRYWTTGHNATTSANNAKAVVFDDESSSLTAPCCLPVFSFWRGAFVSLRVCFFGPPPPQSTLRQRGWRASLALFASLLLRQLYVSQVYPTSEWLA